MRNDNNCSKEHELMPYEALPVIVGLVLTFTTVKLIGPNKRSNLKKKEMSGPKVFKGFYLLQKLLYFNCGSFLINGSNLIIQITTMFPNLNHFLGYLPYSYPRKLGLSLQAGVVEKDRSSNQKLIHNNY